MCAILQENPDNGSGIVILAARQSELSCASVRGIANIKLGLAADSLQKFQIESITKQFTAVATLKLVDQGKAMLEHPLSMYVSGFPNGKQTTLLQFLNHTSGVDELFDIPNFYNTTLRLVTSNQELVTLIGQLAGNVALTCKKPICIVLERPAQNYRHLQGTGTYSRKFYVFGPIKSA